MRFLIQTLLAASCTFCLIQGTISKTNDDIDLRSNSTTFASKNGTVEDDEDIDENPLLVAWAVATYGCNFARLCTIACRFLRNEELDDQASMLERYSLDNGDDDVDQYSSKDVANFIKQYGCPFVKNVAYACNILRVPG